MLRAIRSVSLVDRASMFGRRLVLLGMSAILLGGCSGLGIGGSKNAAPAVDPNLFPADYKPDLLAMLQTYLVDPTNIRDAYITEPVLKPVGSDQRYVVCVRYDAKDGSGRYMGRKDKMVFYFAGKRNQFVDATKDYCGDAVFQPFPELQSLTRPK
jgi:hypothetical protein